MEQKESTSEAWATDIVLERIKAKLKALLERHNAEEVSDLMSNRSRVPRRGSVNPTSIVPPTAAARG